MSKLSDKLNKLGREVAVELATLKLDYNLEEVSIEVTADSTGAEHTSTFKGAVEEQINLDELGNMAAASEKEKQRIILESQGIESAFPVEHG